ncbi:MAG: hypothetical protein H6671_05365 [Anaerolineaceae bacterium]|nr:hypothetical protein [Anaerolineaceae bacterium]
MKHNPKRFPTLIIVALLFVIVLVFNTLSMAFDLTVGRYDGGIREMVYAMRDASGMVLVVFVLVAAFWEIQIRLNWPVEPKTPTSEPSAFSSTAVAPSANGHSGTPIRNGHSDAIRRNRYRMR